MAVALLIILVGSIAGGLYVAREMANPDAGPFTLEFKPVGNRLQLTIPWTSPWLPDSPQASSICEAETERIVSTWFVRMADGTRVRGKWQTGNVQHFVFVIFDDIPKLTTVTLGMGSAPRYEVELQTPSTSVQMKVTMRNMNE